jgi:hypothetical protein
VVSQLISKTVTVGEPQLIVDSARLELMDNTRSGTISYSDLLVGQEESSWNESGLCGGFGGVLGGGGNDGPGDLVWWDVTGIVRAWLDGGPNYGIRIHPRFPFLDEIGFASREAPIASRRPLLVVEYHWTSGDSDTLQLGAAMDIEYWYCSPAENGCDQPSQNPVFCGRDYGMCGFSVRIRTPKFYFDIDESDF